MNNHVCNGFTHSLCLKRIIFAHYTIHTEWVRQVTCQFWNDNTNKIEQVVFPSTIVCQAIAIALVSNQVWLVYVIHTQIVKTLTDWKPLAKHQEPCHSQSFFSSLSVFFITSKVRKKLLMFRRVPLMLWMQVLKHLTEAFQSRDVYVIHCVVFQQQAIITCFIGITEHHLQFLLRTMVVTCMVTFECTSWQIVIDIDRAECITQVSDLDFKPFEHTL